MGLRKTYSETLEQDLISYSPKRWGINFPFKNYTLRMEDMVPAWSGIIGKLSLVAAFAMGWASTFNITSNLFIAENVRLEIILGSIFAIIFCAFLNPYAGPPGTLAPFIPIIPMMASAGVHPLPLSILIGFIGLILSGFKYFSKIVDINGIGTKGGILLMFGFLGIKCSFENLSSWTVQRDPNLFTVLLMIGLILYILFNKYNSRWLIIPACSITAIIVSALFGVFPVMKTGIGLPIISPNIWWNDIWGIGWGLNIENFFRAIPFALLALVMWPIDALAIKTIQETNYSSKAKKAIFDMNNTYMIVSLRNIAGALLGGSQVSAIWRSFMIPLGIVKRPIGGSALILGVIGLIFGVLGFPIDIAIFPPLLWMVLIFGIYIPLIELGLITIKNSQLAQIASICLLAGIAINPVVGWAISIFVENFKVIRDKTDCRILSKEERCLTAYLTSVVIIVFIVSKII